MSTPPAPDRPASAGSRWFARFPAWGIDLLAIAVVLVTSFFGAPMMPFGGGHDGVGGSGPLGPAAPGGPGNGAQPMIGIAVPVLIVLAACALVSLRRRWPAVAVWGGLLLYCLTVALREPSLGVGIVVIIAIYHLGATHTRRTTLLTGIAATLTVVALSLLSSEFGVFDVRVFQIAAGIAVAAALGDSSRSQREAAAAATERAERAERTREAEAQQRVAEERLRIAQDLHDTVAHQISVISLNAGVASSALDAQPDKARTALRTIRRSAREVLTEIGELLTYLRADDEHGAAPPQPGAGEVTALVDRVRELGLAVTLTGEAVLPEITGAAGRVLYRVIQEGLTNAHKHGSAGTATVAIRIENTEAVVRITNPVSPARKNVAESYPGGLGLTGIRERVAAIGGAVDCVTTADSFEIAARLPLKREDPA